MTLNMGRNNSAKNEPLCICLRENTALKFKSRALIENYLVESQLTAVRESRGKGGVDYVADIISRFTGDNMLELV